MDVFNQHTTSSNQLLFSLIHNDRKFDFICSSQMQVLNEAVVVACKMYPLNEAGEIIRIKNNSLKVQINQLLLKSSINIALTGFKIKINPVSGSLSVQNSFLSHFIANQKLFDCQFLQNYQKQVIKQFCNCEGVKKAFIRILQMISSGCSLSRRQPCINQMLKFSFNSEFYVWVSPNQQDTRKLQQQNQGNNSQRITRKQPEVWSDCDSDFQQFSDKESQTNQSLEYRGQLQNPEEKVFSKFYRRNRNLYNNLNLSSQGNRSYEGLPLNFGALSKNLFIKFFISERDDRGLYQKYLQKYVLDYQSQCGQLKQQTSETPQKFGPDYFFYALNKQQQQVNQQQLNLQIYLENNKLSISKQSIWNIVLGLVQRIYKDFLRKQLKPMNDYLVMTMYKVERGLAISWKIKSQSYNRSIIPKKVRALKESKVAVQQMSSFEQDQMKEEQNAMKEQQDQKNLYLFSNPSTNDILKQDDELEEPRASQQKLARIKLKQTDLMRVQDAEIDELRIIGGVLRAASESTTDGQGALWRLGSYHVRVHSPNSSKQSLTVLKLIVYFLYWKAVISSFIIGFIIIVVSFVIAYSKCRTK